MIGKLTNRGRGPYNRGAATLRLLPPPVLTAGLAGAFDPHVEETFPMRSIRSRRAAILVAGGALLLLLVAGGLLLAATLAPAPPAGTGDTAAQPAATPRPPSTLRKILDAE